MHTHEDIIHTAQDMLNMGLPAHEAAERLVMRIEDMTGTHMDPADIESLIEGHYPEGGEVLPQGHMGIAQAITRRIVLATEAKSFADLDTPWVDTFAEYGDMRVAAPLRVCVLATLPVTAFGGELPYHAR